MVAIYANPINIGKFSVGYVLATNEMCFVMENISPLGKYDGLLCHLIDDINKIEYDSEYIKNINKLIAYHGEERNIFKNFKDHPLFDLLEYAKTNNKICTIELCGSDLTDAAGFIESFEKDTVKIKLITEAGKYDGIAIIKLEQLARIWCDSEDYRMYEWLYKLNN